MGCHRVHAARDTPVLYVMLIVKDWEFRPSICGALGWTIAMNVVSLDLSGQRPGKAKQDDQ